MKSRKAARWVIPGIGLFLLAACDSAPTPEEHFANAQKYFEEGKRKAALIEAQNAVKADSEVPEYRWLLAQIYLSQGNGPAASKELQWTRRLGLRTPEVEIANVEALVIERKYKEALRRLNFLRLPPSEKTQLLRGRVEVGLRRYDAAEAAFNEVMKTSPESTEAKRGLARIALAREDYARAQELTKRIGEDKEKVEDLLVHGEASLRSQELEGAQESFEQALKKAPRNVAAAVGLARTLLAQNKPVAAYQALDELGERARSHPVVRYYQGIAAHMQGDNDIARAALLEVTGKIPNHTPSLMLLATSHYTSGEYAKAIDYASSVLDVTPDTVEARRLLAAAQLRNNQAHLTVETLTEKGVPENDYRWLSLLGTAYLQLREYERGTQLLEKAASLAPEQSSVKTQLALGHLVMGESEEALAALATDSAAEPEIARSELIQAFVQLRERDFDAALATTEKLIKAQPDNPVVYNVKAAALAGKGDIDGAESEFRRAIEASPNYLTARINLSRLAERRGDRAAAKAELEEILAIRADHPNALVALARIAGAEGDRANQLALLERARVKNPTAALPRQLLANYYVASFRAAEALTIARELQEIEPTALSSQLILGRSLLLSNQRDDAFDTLTVAADNFPQSPAAHHQLALAKLARGDHAGAQESLQQAVSLNADYFPAQIALGRLQLVRANPKGALAIATQLAEKLPDNSNVQMLKGDSHVALRENGAAVTAYEKAFAGRPTANSTLKFANALTRAGETKRAQEILNNWLKSNPEDTKVRLALATALQRSGNVDAASQTYRRILDIQPNNVVALNNLSWMLLKSGDPQAVDMAKRAHELAPDSPEILDTYGWILVRSGSSEQGLSLLRRAMKARPDLLDIGYHYAVGLAQTGERAQAKATLERILAATGPFSERDQAERLAKSLSQSN